MVADLSRLEDKALLRQQALQARGQGGDAAALMRNLHQVLAPWRGLVLSGYWPIRDEADPRPAMAAHQGPLCLPVVIAKGQPLLFRRWNGGDDGLEPGNFGTRHPAPTQPELTPQVMIVPLAGFDRHGNRLGYGGGFYDRTLAKLRAKGQVRAIALAWAAQELPFIPTEPTDQPVDLIVTEHEIIHPNRGSA